MSRLEGGRGGDPPLYSFSFLSYREGILGVLNSFSSYLKQGQRGERVNPSLALA